jgi:hypothetical protein
LFSAAAPALAHLDRDRTTHHVAGREVLCLRRVALHEALALAVDQETALATHALGDQHPATGDPGRVKLHELHVFERHARAQRHGHAIAGVAQGVGVGAEDLPCAAGGDQRGLGLDHDRLAAQDLEGHHAQHVAFCVLDQIDREVLVEEVRPCAKVLLVQRVQDRMTGPVRGGTGSCRLFLSEILALATEGTLIDAAIVQP